MYQVLLVAHLLGVMLVFLAVGGQVFHVINGGEKESTESRGLLMATHGIGLLLLFVAGFGLHGMGDIEGFPAWLIAKLLIWVILGGFTALVWKRPESARAFWFLAPLLGLFAAAMAVSRPF